MRKLLSALIAVAAGVAVAMFTADTIHTWETRNRCEYMFPWSGRCRRFAHHPGNHW